MERVKYPVNTERLIRIKFFSRKKGAKSQKRDTNVVIFVRFLRLKNFGKRGRDAPAIAGETPGVTFIR
jgi:hypothetical protein